MANGTLGDSWAFGKPYRPFMTRRRKRWSAMAAIAAFMLFAGATVALADVWTDKYDYAYGETVQINGDGMWPGEAVDVDVNFPDGSLAQHHGVTADEFGNFSDSFYLADGMPTGIYTVVATGLASGNVFTTEFDPNVNVDTLLTLALSDNSITLGESINLSGALVANPADPDSAANPVPAGRTITLAWYTSAGCGAGTGTSIASVTTSNPGGTYGPLSYTPASSGTQYIRADFDGHSVGSPPNQTSWLKSSSSCLRLDIAPSTPTNTLPVVTIVSGATAVNEGDAATLYSYSWTDPGADVWTQTTTCGATGTKSDEVFTPASKTGSFKCAWADDNPTATAFDTETVSITVDDDDTGTDTKTRDVTVSNVAPSAVSASFGTPISCSATTNTAEATLSFSFVDPGEDTWDAQIDWDYDGVTFDNVETKTGVNKSDSATHSYITGGVHTAGIKILDDDSGVSAIQTATVIVDYNTSGILQPVNWTQAQNDPSVFKWGSTLPIKVQFFNCDGSNAGGSLSVGVTINRVTSSTPPYGEDETIANTNSPDSGGYMRWSDPLYIYNLATKSLGDKTATYRITLTVMSTGQKVYTNFGTREK